MADGRPDRIDLTEIRELSKRFFDALHGSGFTHIVVPDAQYFTVFSTEAFGLETPELVVGDVFDDLHDLRQEVLPEADTSPVLWHAAHHLAGLITLIAHADAHDTLIKAERV